MLFSGARQPTVLADEEAYAPGAVRRMVFILPDGLELCRKARSKRWWDGW